MIYGVGERRALSPNSSRVIERLWRVCAAKCKILVKSKGRAFYAAQKKSLTVNLLQNYLENVSSLLSENTSLAAKVLNVKQKLDTVSSEKDAMQKSVQSLEEKVSDLKSEILNVKKKCKKFVDKIEEQNFEIENLKRE